MCVNATVSRRLVVLAAVFIGNSLPHATALAEERLAVLPVIFVPADNTDTVDFSASLELIYRHLELARRHWHDVLDTDTFAISRLGTVYHGQQQHAYYVPPNSDKSEGLARLLVELFRLENDNRVDSRFVYLIVYARPDFAAEVGPKMGGGRTFNGMPNTGGGGVQMELSSLLTDQPYPFQSTLVHELGHAFGLTHSNCYGYDLKSNSSMMSYNPRHHSHGLVEGEYADLNPEEYFIISQNKLAFPNFRYVASIHNPGRKPLTTIEQCYLGPMPTTIGGDDRRQLHGVGYELFFDGRLVSGPNASFFSRAEAQQNCQWNRDNHAGITIECRYNGKRFGP